MGPRPVHEEPSWGVGRLKWAGLPGPSAFFGRLLDKLRDGIGVVIAAPATAHPDLERAVESTLDHERWPCLSLSYSGDQEPLQFLTEHCDVEPERSVGWNAGGLVQRLSPSVALLVDGVTDRSWGPWQKFLREFDAASRSLPSGRRPLLVLTARGVPRARLGVDGVALAIIPWAAVIGELDVLSHVDRIFRDRQVPLPRHYKLLVRQVVALAQWDLPLAEFLTGQLEHDLFDPLLVLGRARDVMGPERFPSAPDWHLGGTESFDGLEMRHPYVLLAEGDPSAELRRRLWAAQASELLPLIELRRRELLVVLARYIPMPLRFRDEQIGSLEELEVGSLAYLARRERLRPELVGLVQTLARYRNSLAHLETLNSAEALDPRLHASGAVGERPTHGQCRTRS